MKRKYFCLLLLLLCIPLAGGCDEGNFFDIQSTMKPPALNQDEELIKLVIDRKFGDDFILKYPQRGEYRSAILLYDFDGNGQDTAITFYRTNREKKTIHILVMKKINGVWGIVKDFLNSGDDIDKVCFGDINGDGRDEIIVGWSDVETNINNISAYEVDEENVNEIKFDKKYIEFSLVNGTDILLVSPSSTNNSFYAYLLKIKNGKFFENSTIKFNDSIVRCNSLIYGKISDEQNGFFIDYTNLEGQTITEIICVENRLSRITNENINVNSIKRNVPILSKDVNNDSIVEVPILNEVESVLGNENEVKTYMVRWSNFDIIKKQFINVRKSVCNYEMGYNLFVPDGWDKNIVCCMDSKCMSEKFYEQSVDRSGNKYVGDLLLEIKKVSMYDWQSMENKQQYVLLSEDNGFVYIAYVPDVENELVVDGESLKENFEIIK